MVNRQTHDADGWAAKGIADTGINAWQRFHALTLNDQRTEYVVTDSMTQHFNNRMRDLMHTGAAHGIEFFQMYLQHLTIEGKPVNLDAMKKSLLGAYRKKERGKSTPLRENLRDQLVSWHVFFQSCSSLLTDPDIEQFPKVGESARTLSTLALSKPRSWKDWMQFVMDATKNVQAEPYTSSARERSLLADNVDTVVNISHAMLYQMASTCPLQKGVEVLMDLTDIPRDMEAGNLLQAARRAKRPELGKFFHEMAFARAKAAKWLALIDVFKKNSTFSSDAEHFPVSFLLEERP